MRTKKAISVLLVCMMLLSCLSVAALADGVSGLYLEENSKNYKIAFFSGTEPVNEPEEAEIDDTTYMVYAEADHFKVTLTGLSNGSYYLIAAMDATNATSEDETSTGAISPTESNLRYIDQDTAEGGEVVFDVYPSQLTVGAKYMVCISSNTDNGALTPIFKLQYLAEYLLGDANGDRSVDVSDVLTVLEHIVGKRTLTGSNYSAANVKTGENNESIDVTDVLAILKYIVGPKTWD